MSDQLVAETSTWQHNGHNRQTSMPPAEFEPAIPVGDRLQTHALDRSATAIGSQRANIAFKWPNSQHEFIEVASNEMTIARE